MKMETRMAPQGARLMFGQAGAPSRAMVEAGLRRQGASPSTIGAAVTTMGLDGEAAPETPPATPPAPPEPTIPERLADHDAMLADHESRIGRIEGVLNLTSETAPTPPADPAPAAKAGTALDGYAILARHGEMRRERAAAMQGGQRVAATAPPRQAPPPTCTTLDAAAVYARLAQHRAGKA